MIFWLISILLFISIAFNVFMIWSSRLQSKNYSKQFQILTVKYNIIMDKYNSMINFLEVIIKNPRYTEAFLEFDPIVSEILNRIKDLHNTLVNLSDGDESLYYKENFEPDEIENEESNAS